VPARNVVEKPNSPRSYASHHDNRSVAVFPARDEFVPAHPFWRSGSCQRSPLVEKGRLTMRIVVIGGTGLIGSKLVRA